MNPTTNASMKEDDIRPSYLMQGQSERFLTDIRRLLQHKGDFVHTSCPACESASSDIAFEKYDLTYALCHNCGTLYVNPRPSPAILEEYYVHSENYAYWNRYVFPASEEVRREKIFRPRVQRVTEICRRQGVKTRTLLEVGAGFGTFCEEMRQYGLFDRLIAVEPTPDLAETCRLKGLEVIQEPIEHVNLSTESVDVIVSFETIEHLFSPKDFLLICAKLLAPNGLLVLTCPNIKGFDLVVLGAASDTVDVEHLNYFHPTSLSFLLTTCGYEVLEIMTPGRLDAELVRKKALLHEFDLSNQPFLRQILLEAWEQVAAAFQDFLVQANLSSHMWVVARRTGRAVL